jgi:predicted anti-sigma-YlaC factor YlaD
MTHEEIQILISAYVDGEVTPSEKTIVEEHLSSCTSCQQDYKQYMAMSSSLSKWSDETLSPDESINVQKKFEQRREPMFTKRNVMSFATTLALAMIVGSVVLTTHKIHLQGRLKSAADDIGDQYSDAKKSMQYQPVYASSSYSSQFAANKNLGSAFVDADKNVPSARFAMAPVEERQSSGLQQSVENAAAPVAAAMYLKAPINYERKVIKTAQITLNVVDAGKTQNTLADLVARYNGLVISSQINKAYDGSITGTVEFKVYPKDLGNVLLEVRKLGEVQWESQAGEDVTEQYVDSQARLENFKAVRERLHKTLDENAHKVDDILEVEREIARVEGEIDSLESMIKLYETQSAMSTVTVSFTEKAKNVFKSVEPENKWVSTLKQSYEGFINNFTGIIIITVSCLPVVIWLLAFWGIFLLIRKFFFKK